MTSAMLRTPSSAMSRCTSSFQQGERALHGRLATRHRGEQERPADEDELRAERERLEHVGAAPHAPVQYHGHAVRLGRDLGQRPQRRHRMVELTAAID